MYRFNSIDIYNKLLIPYIHNATLEKTFNNSSLPKSISGNEYNINMWLYINEYNYRNENDKCILFLGSLNNGGTLNEQLDDSHDIKKEGSPSIWLKKYTNTLVVVTGLQTSFDNPCNTDEDNNCIGSGINIDKCEIENFPIQKWVNLNISLRSNALDIFMNGKLILAKGGVLVTSELSKFQVGEEDGISGGICNVVYFSDTLSKIKIDYFYNYFKNKNPPII